MTDNVFLKVLNSFSIRETVIKNRINGKLKKLTEIMSARSRIKRMIKL